MTALSLQTYIGGPAGMSRKAPQHEIDDLETWSCYDVNLEDPGFLKRRGPLTATSATGAGRTTRYGIGLARVQSPDGLEQMIALVGKSGSAASEVYGFGANSSGLNSGGSTMAWPYDVGHAPYELFNTNPSAGKGCWIGTANKYDKPTNQALVLWRGGIKDDATNLACTSFATGATSIIVTSAIASCSPGHHVFDHDTGYLVGVIKSISGSTITLENKALYTAACTNIDVRVFRGAQPRVSVGRISTHTDGVIYEINGGATKFKQQGLDTTWDLYKTDYTWIGNVLTVESDVQLHLAAAAAVELSNDDYIAIKRTGYSTGYSPTAGTLGWLNCSFGGHQFFAGTGVNGNELLFSDDTDPEAVDTTVNGNSIIFSEDPIRALIPCATALVVVTENEAFALTGAIGTTPDAWRGERIHDDGTISGMSALTYKGGACWAGKRGIWYWDAGGNPLNVVGKLDDDYRKFVAGFSSASNRAYGMIVRDHYLCFMDGGASSIFTYTKGSTTTSITRPTFDVQLSTGSIAIHRNVEFRGSITPPEFLGLGTNLFLVTTTVPDARILTGDTLYTTETGTDAYACNGSATTNADFYVETKKYDQGDGQRLKLHRMLLLHFCTTAGNIKFDTVVGLNTTGVTSQTEYQTSASYVDKRIKFNARSQYLAFRFYQSETDGTGQETVATSVTCTSASPMVVTKNSHGLAVGMKVIFGGTAAPTGITAGSTYFVSSVPTADTFQVSATYGGASVNSSSTGTAVKATYGVAAALTRLKMGGWAIGYKWKRPGRV